MLNTERNLKLSLNAHKESHTLCHVLVHICMAPPKPPGQPPLILYLRLLYCKVRVESIYYSMHLNIGCPLLYILLCVVYCIYEYLFACL